MSVYYFVRVPGVFVLSFLERDAGPFECDIVAETRSIVVELLVGLCRRPFGRRSEVTACRQLVQLAEKTAAVKTSLHAPVICVDSCTDQILLY